METRRIKYGVTGSVRVRDMVRVRYRVDQISSRIFVTLRYRDEDPIVEKPGAVIIVNYASVTIISDQRKTYTY